MRKRTAVEGSLGRLQPAIGATAEILRDARTGQSRRPKLKVMQIVLGLLTIAFWTFPAHAQFSDLPIGVDVSGSVSVGQQRFYKFRVRKDYCYHVEVVPWGPDLDLYGDCYSTVDRSRGVSNQGASCRVGSGVWEHFFFQSNYGGYYFLSVYGVEGGTFAVVARESQAPQAPTVMTSYPNAAGIVWTVGQSQTITWTKTPSSEQFDKTDLQISRDAGASFHSLNLNPDSLATSYPWTPTQGWISDHCRMKVQGVNYNTYYERAPYSPGSPYLKPWITPSNEFNNYQDFRIVDAQAADHLEITGDDSVVEGHTAQYTCYLVHPNNNRDPKSSGVTWYVDPPYASITGQGLGLLTANPVPSDQHPWIRATWNGMQAQKIITILNVSGSPVIHANKASLSPRCQAGQVASEDTFVLTNTGEGTLSYSITDNAAWLSAGPSSGTCSPAGDTITITYDTALLGAGPHNAQIQITAPGAITLNIPVALTVDPLPAPAIGRNTAKLSATCPAGNSPASQTFTIRNTGSATLSYSITKDVAWLSVNPASGSCTTETDTITASFSMSGMKAGSYPATITITALGATNSPQTIAVTLTITTPTNQTKNLQNEANTIEPVNTFSGAYLYSHQDLAIPGRGLPFEFARFYSSRANALPGEPVGPKWRHTYMVSLEEQSEQTVVHWANCSEDYFVEDPPGSGQYSNLYAGYSGKLTKNGDNTFDFVTKALVKYHFDSSGTLLAISDRNDNALTMVYTAGVLTAVQDAAGRQLLFEYTGGRLTKVTDFAETPRYIEFAYETNGDLKTFADVLRHPMQYSYDPAFPDDHCLMTIVDRRGNTVVTNVYTDIDSDPLVTDLRVTSQTNGRGKTWDYAYDPATGITTETDPQQPTRGVTTYQYDEHSWLVKKTDPKGNYEQYTYDDNGDRTVLDNARRKTTSFTYDAHGNVLTVSDALSNVTTFEYNANDQVTLVRDAKSRETRYQYDGRGNLIKLRRPLNHVTEYVYDEHGQLLTVTDAMGHITTHGYDEHGNRTSTTNALGQTTQFAYDEVGRLTDITEPSTPPAVTHFDYYADDSLENITDQEDNVTHYEYDQNGNRTLVKNPKLIDTHFDYNENNLLGTVSDAYSKTTVTGYDDVDRVATVKDRWDKTSTFEYDLTGNRTKAIAPDATFTQFGYDENGNRTSITNANPHTSTIAYDDLDRVWKVIDALGNTTENTYDEVGRLVKVKDANLNETVYTYDDLDRLTQVEDPLHGTAKYTYDLNGNRTSITDPNNHTTVFEYDALNRAISETDAVGKGFRYEYDPVGNLSKRTDTRNNVTTYDYFLNHKLNTVHYPGGGTVEFTYDANGNRTQMTDANGSTAWVYDNLDRITQVTDPFNNIVGYAYDLPSEVRKRIVYPGTTPSPGNVDYAFDDNGRLQSLTDWAGHTFTYHYDPAGNVAQLDYPNGCKEKRAYYDNERLKTLTHEKPDATEFIAYSYTYDSAGNITAMNRKEAVHRDFAKELTDYTYDIANEILTANANTFAFDANGNQIWEMDSTGTTNYTYDYENRLTQVDPPGADLSQFAYNGIGDRLKSVENGTEKRYLLDPNKPLTDVLAVLDASNAPQQYYLYGLCLVARVTPSGGLFQYHPDHLGSIMAITDQSSAITAAFAYHEFGALAASTGFEAGPWRFCGAIGLQQSSQTITFARSRYLATSTGRFLSQDVIKHAASTQGLHQYSYVMNCPLMLVDPLGLEPIDGQVHMALGTDGSTLSRSDPAGERKRLEQELTYWLLVDQSVGYGGKVYGSEEDELKFTFALGGTYEEHPSKEMYEAPLSEIGAGFVAPYYLILSLDNAQKEADRMISTQGVDAAEKRIHDIRMEHDPEYRQQQGVYTWQERAWQWFTGLFR